MLSTKRLSLLIQPKTACRLLLCAAAICALVARGAEGRLWLPADMTGLMPDLERAAAAAVETERCGEVLRGNWNRNYSNDEFPAFMLICRDASNGSSYYLIYRRIAANKVELYKEQPPASQWQPPQVEKKAVETVSSDIERAVVAPTSTQADVSADQQALPPPLDEEQAWQHCLRELQQSTQRMIDVIVYEQPRPHAEQNQQGWRFRIPFDARNPRGDDLYFVGICQTGTGEVNLDLKPRRD